MSLYRIAAPLCATAALFLAIGGAPVSAAGPDDFTRDGIKLRGDGSVDDSQPGAAPVFTVETTTNPDGTTTVTRTRVLSATGAAPLRTRTVETTRAEDGALIEKTRSDIRTNADGIDVRERTDDLQIIDGTAVRVRTDIRRDSEGQVIRSRERSRTVERGAGIERAEKTERPEKLARVERTERPEKVERPEKPERPEKAERPEKVERPEKIERRGRD